MKFLQEMRIAHLIRYLRFCVFIKFPSASGMVRLGVQKKEKKEIKMQNKNNKTKNVSLGRFYVMVY